MRASVTDNSLSRTSIVNPGAKFLGEYGINENINRNHTQKGEESCTGSDLLTGSQVLETNQSQLDFPEKKRTLIKFRKCLSARESMANRASIDENLKLQVRERKDKPILGERLNTGETIQDMLKIRTCQSDRTVASLAMSKIAIRGYPIQENEKIIKTTTTSIRSSIISNNTIKEVPYTARDFSNSMNTREPRSSKSIDDIMRESRAILEREKERKMENDASSSNTGYYLAQTANNTIQPNKAAPAASIGEKGHYDYYKEKLDKISKIVSDIEGKIREHSQERDNSQCSRVAENKVSTAAKYSALTKPFSILEKGDGKNRICETEPNETDDYRFDTKRSYRNSSQNSERGGSYDGKMRKLVLKRSKSNKNFEGTGSKVDKYIKTEGGELSIVEDNKQSKVDNNKAVGKQIEDTIEWDLVSEDSQASHLFQKDASMRLDNSQEGQKVNKGLHGFKVAGALRRIGEFEGVNSARTTTAKLTDIVKIMGKKDQKENSKSKPDTGFTKNKEIKYIGDKKAEDKTRRAPEELPKSPFKWNNEELFRQLCTPPKRSNNHRHKSSYGDRSLTQRSPRLESTDLMFKPSLAVDMDIQPKGKQGGQCLFESPRKPVKILEDMSPNEKKTTNFEVKEASVDIPKKKEAMKRSKSSSINEGIIRESEKKTNMKLRTRAGDSRDANVGLVKYNVFRKDSQKLFPEKNRPERAKGLKFAF